MAGPKTGSVVAATEGGERGSGLESAEGWRNRGSVVAATAGTAGTPLEPLEVEGAKKGPPNLADHIAKVRRLGG